MKACYPGTFDPITIGHMDIITRSARMFDEVEVLIMENPRKKCTFSAEERKQMIEDCLKDAGGCDNVRVHIGTGLTVEYARKLGCGVIIRGIRAVSDYEYELQQATANMVLAEEIETLFLIARPLFSFLSSSVIKEIALNNGSIENLVPHAIEQKVAEKLKQ